ncbi:MAG TPA: hypothetical protein DCP69_12550 [Candidatus Omnitrophica bacterium]|nr:hypothetical protein [Candidatus Omnitrophota bacterium]
MGRFTPADVGAEIHYELLKFKEISRWLVSRLHPSGFRCPRCQADLGGVEARREKWESLEQVRCCECGKKFSAATGTLLEGSKLEPREIFLMADYIDLEVPPRRIAERLKIDVGTVRSWQSKFKALAEVAGA